MKKMRDLHNFSAKAFKDVLFTGAQASKSWKKSFFTTSKRKFDSERWTKLEQRQPKALCSQAPKQEKTGNSSFSTHL